MRSAGCIVNDINQCEDRSILPTLELDQVNSYYYNPTQNNNNSDIDKLSVKSIIVNQGMRLKRMKPRARGRADRIQKKSCHINLALNSKEI